ncbi:MAG: type 4a pilus biogenesis protein PilO [Gammaproteobacteria bacterium]|nr:type 4a pilus biogenesis protein PilO [Gammaproteobacteria bacterium]NIR59127.1 type 4a pilus biogenesis protein PilO [Gammaproteobacteria bacterium]
MNLQQLNELDFKNIGSWPAAAKAVAVAFLFALVLAGGYWFDIRHQREYLAESQRKETELKKTFEQKQAKAANLEAYKEQLAKMEESFGAMLRQLPSKAEVAELLVDISQTGLANGLQFQLFKPQAERRREFYAELPIEIRVTGTYHDFGGFVSDVAALPRIVTLHNIKIKPGGGEGGRLTMDLTAKTYRYLEADEKANTKDKKGKGKKGRRRG